MGYRLSKIYTRKGDDGTTSLDAKNRLLKNNLRVEAIGTVDELNSVIGMVVSFITDEEDVRSCLMQAQHHLFDLGGELCPPFRVVINAEMIEGLEKIIDRWNEDLLPLKEFILPGGTHASSTCHLARTVCRRAERVLVTLQQQEKINPECLRYLNRLSDVLFVAAS